VKSGGGTDLLRGIIQRCAQDSKMPEVHVLFGRYGEQTTALRTGTADVGLLRAPFDPRADLVGEPMPRWELHDDTATTYWAAQHAAPVGFGRPRTAPAYDRHDGDPAAKSAAVTQPADGPPVTDIGQLLDAAALGQTIAFLPLSAAHQYNRPDLVFRPVVDLGPSMLVAAWPDSSRSLEVAAFVQAASDVAREFSHGDERAFSR
jgi:DNA-binding transcriptional LysR family regulator